MNVAPITLFKTKKEAEAIVGTLSKPSKMPGHGYSIPAQECKTGGKLRQIKGSVCSNCYACKGRYGFPAVKNALYKRFGSINDPRWVEAITHLIRLSGDTHFRWHDSGDIQNISHLHKIVRVCENLPSVRFWLPTKELGIVRAYIRDFERIPDNLTIRISAPLKDRILGGSLPTSSVHTEGIPAGSHECPAPKQGNTCGECRACWDKNVKNVAYHNH